MNRPDARTVVHYVTKTCLANRYGVSVRRINTWLSKEAAPIRDLNDLLDLLVRWDNNVKGMHVPEPIQYLDDSK